MQELKKKRHGSGTTTLTISFEEKNDIMKIVQAFEDSNILLKGVTKTIKNETKEQKDKNIIKMNQDLMVFFQEIIYLKK